MSTKKTAKRRGRPRKAAVMETKSVRLSQDVWAVLADEAAIHNETEDTFELGKMTPSRLINIAIREELKKRGRLDAYAPKGAA